jgi:hypothetical protein
VRKAKGDMSMFKFLLPYTILFLLLFTVFISAYAQPNCCSSLTVSVVSSDAMNLNGFSIKLDGRNIGVTDNYGYLTISLSQVSKGRHSIQASKQEEGTTIVGSRQINIPCVNASSGSDCPVAVEVSPLPAH